MSNGRRQIDYTNKDYASILAALLDLAAEKLPEWTDRSPNDLGVMLLELFAHMGDTLFYNQDRIAGESFLETAVERRSVVQLLRLIGYELRPPLPASADLTLLFRADATGPVAIPTGAAFRTTAAAGAAPIDFQFVQQPITIDRTSLPLGAVDARGNLTMPPPAPLPRGSTVYKVYRTVPVLQVDATVTNEIVASSDGSARQRHALARSPVIDSTLAVTVDEGGGPVVWTRVASLFDSRGTDTHYSLRRDENGVVWIELGDGTYGKIPRRGFNNITAAYRVGGGTKGNVGAGAIRKPVTGIDDLRLVLNLSPASGGTEAEATSDAVLRGPRQFRAMGRAVTASDYEALAKAFGVGKAIAQSPGWNTVQLVVAPAGGGYATDSLKEDLLTFLDGKRVMTSIVEIADPTYVQVFIRATVTVQPQYSRRLVQQQVEDVVARLLAFENVDFGQTLFISKVYEVIEDIEGVLGVNIDTFARTDPSDPQRLPTPGTLPRDGQLRFTGLGELPTWMGFGGPASRLEMLGGVTNG